MKEKITYFAGGLVTGVLVVGLAAYTVVKVAPDMIMDYAINKSMHEIRETIIAPIMARIPDSAAVTSQETDYFGTKYNLALDFSGHTSAAGEVVSQVTGKMKNEKFLSLVRKLEQKANESAKKLSNFKGTHYDHNPKGLSLGDKLMLSNGNEKSLDVSIELLNGRPVLMDNLTYKKFDPGEYSTGTKAKIIEQITLYLERR